MLLLADSGGDRGVLRSGRTGEMMVTLTKAGVRLSADGKRILAVPELSTAIDLFDDTGRLLWSHSGSSDAHGDLARLSGHVLYWNLDTVELLLPDVDRKWKWQSPSGEWIRKAQISPDGRLALISTGAAPPYLHGDGGRLRQTVLINVEGRVVARAERPNATLPNGRKTMTPVRC